MGIKNAVNTLGKTAPIETKFREALMSRQCGLYILKKDNEIIYIGITTRWSRRKLQHDKTKDFDDYDFFQMPIETAKVWERHLIYYIKPILNSLYTARTVIHYRDKLNRPKWFIAKTKPNERIISSYREKFLRRTTGRLKRNLNSLAMEILELNPPNQNYDLAVAKSIAIIDILNARLNPKARTI